MKTVEKLLNLKRGLMLCHKLAPTYIGRRCVMMLLSTLSAYLSIYLSGIVVSIITGENSFDEALIAAVICVGARFLFSIASVLITVPTARQLMHGFTTKANMMVAEKCMSLDFIRIENPETHRIKERAESFLYGMGRRNGFERLLLQSHMVFEAFVTVVIGFAMCFKPLFITPAVSDGFMGFMQSGWATLILCLLYCIMIVANVKVAAKQGKIFSNFHSDGKLNQINRVLGFYLDFHRNRYQRGKDVRIYNQSEMLLGEWENYHEKLMECDRNLFKRLCFSDLASPVLSVLISVFTYAFVIIRAVGGMYGASEAVVFVMSITKLITGITSLLGYRVEFFDIMPQNIKRVFEFFDIQNEKYQGTIPTEKRDDNEYEFEFKHVYFKYPDSDEYVLQDINLKWRIGEKMALVGRNGSGKSTLIKLLCRLYDPTGGEIALNGIDIRKYDYREYMDLFSVVFQDSKLFSFSIAENVAADTVYDGKLAEACVRKAGLSDRLDKMPDGIKTCLYKDFDEKGVEISGGEAQKLCLARAVYKGAPFIVLDEPTAALDPVSEHDIYTKFNSIAGTKTAVYISHRLSSCRFCDDIAVLENGRIVERGAHNELLAKDGVYAKLWRAQAEYYEEADSSVRELFA